MYKFNKTRRSQGKIEIFFRYNVQRGFINDQAIRWIGKTRKALEGIKLSWAFETSTCLKINLGKNRDEVGIELFKGSGDRAS